MARSLSAGGPPGWCGGGWSRGVLDTMQARRDSLTLYVPFCLGLALVALASVRQAEQAPTHPVAAQGPVAVAAEVADTATPASQPPAAAPSGDTAITSAPHARTAEQTRGGRIPELEYRIAPGDSLSGIARHFGVPVERLVVTNGLRNRHRIRAGMLLRVPMGVDELDPRTLAALPDDLEDHPERLQLVVHFERWAHEYDIEPDLLKAVGWVESRWRSNALSNRGAIGIGQLMPDTVEFVSKRLVGETLNPWRPDQNIKMSAAFLRYLLDETNDDSVMALAAYYQGLGAVRRQGIYAQTRPYVARVMRARRHFVVG